MVFDLQRFSTNHCGWAVRMATSPSQFNPRRQQSPFRGSIAFLETKLNWTGRPFFFFFFLLCAGVTRTPLRVSVSASARDGHVMSVHATATLTPCLSCCLGHAPRPRADDDDAGGGWQRRRLFRPLLPHPSLVSLFIRAIAPFVVTQVTGRTDHDYA